MTYPLDKLFEKYKNINISTLFLLCEVPTVFQATILLDRLNRSLSRPWNSCLRTIGENDIENLTHGQKYFYLLM